MSDKYIFNIMDEGLGLTELEIEHECGFEEDILSPRSSMRTLHQQASIQDNFSNYL